MRLDRNSGPHLSPRERREEYLRATGKFHTLVAEGFISFGVHDGGRNDRMRELDEIVKRQIRNEPKEFRRNPGRLLLVSDARRVAAKANAEIGNAMLTSAQIRERCVKAQAARKYSRTCECGTCPKCKHRESKRNYLQRRRQNTPFQASTPDLTHRNPLTDTPA